MKHIFIIGVAVVLLLFFMVNKKTDNDKPIVEKYPWQVTVLPAGRSRVFGVVLSETLLKDIDVILKNRPTIALFETNGKLSLEAYYKNVSLGGLIGSFIFTLNATDAELNEIKQGSSKKKRTENNNIRYELDKQATDNAKELTVNNLNYIPTAQLDEETILKRFGEPAHKIKLKTQEAGWHYLYPEKGLDLIYKEEGKEVLQYVLPKDFNALLEPLQSLQNQKH
ncbi:MAG: hypothetical protein OQK75_01655 [Gammaproteobacteria bacterium]|nr:hypothetical protein [Gammaproteobacteria bacterium]MCW8986351.1 hypothetical protein [Gammaproteobacteria bacterium]